MRWRGGGRSCRRCRIAGCDGPWGVGCAAGRGVAPASPTVSSLSSGRPASRSCSAETRCVGASCWNVRPMVVTMSMARSSDTRHNSCTGSTGTPASSTSNAAARRPTSRMSRTSTSAAPGSHRYSQVLRRVVTESAISPTQAANFDHSSSRMSLLAVALMPAASMASAMRCTRAVTGPRNSPTRRSTLRVNRTEPESSNSPLKFATAPITAAGPNSSSEYARMPGVTPVSTVGAYQAPSRSSRLPPARTVAPWVTASSICAARFSTAWGDERGPR